MKSSSDGLVGNYLKVVLKPNDAIPNINRREKDLFESLMIVLVSGGIFLLGIFLTGALIYNTFFEQYSTFVLEQATSGTLFGFQISRYDYILVFVSELIFVMKSWLFFSIGFFIFMRLFGEKESLKETMILYSWVIYPYAWLIFGFNMVCLILKFILPLIYHYIFYVGLATIFLMFVPITLQRFYDNMAKDGKKQISQYKVLVSYYMVLFVAVVLYGTNHMISINLTGFL